MGCSNNDIRFNRDIPLKMVQIPDSNFRIDTTEITFNLYDLYTDQNNQPRKNDHGWGRKDKPVIGVSWVEAQGFIAWMNKTYSPIKPFRLPTEEEWIEALGEHWKNKKAANCNSTCKDQYKNTAPVKSFKAGNYGLYDMFGNVWEWTSTQSTLSNKSMKSNSKSRIKQEKYILKGGSWENSQALLTPFSRVSYSSNTKHYSFGFRLAQDI